MATKKRTRTSIHAQQKHRRSPAIKLPRPEISKEEWEKRTRNLYGIVSAVIEQLDAGLEDPEKIAKALVPEYDSMMPLGLGSSLGEQVEASRKHPRMDNWLEPSRHHDEPEPLSGDELKYYVNEGVRCANSRCNKKAGDPYAFGVLVIHKVYGSNCVPQFGREHEQFSEQKHTWYCSDRCAMGGLIVEQAHGPSEARHEIIKAIAERLQDVPIWIEEENPNYRCEYPCPPIDIDKMMEAAGVDVPFLKRMEQRHQEEQARNAAATNQSTTADTSHKSA